MVDAEEVQALLPQEEEEAFLSHEEEEDNVLHKSHHFTPPMSKNILSSGKI